MLELASFGLVVYLGIEVASRDHPADPERRSEVTRAELHTRCEVIGLTKGIHRQRSTYTKQLGNFLVCLQVSDIQSCEGDRSGPNCMLSLKTLPNFNVT